MMIEVGLENNVEGRCLAWALDYPGCFAYGCDAAAALANMPVSVESYWRWVTGHSQEKEWVAVFERVETLPLNLSSGEIQIVVDETFDVYGIDEKFNLAKGTPFYEVNAWFKHDWKPLSTLEVRQAIAILHWCRADLLSIVKDKNPQDLYSVPPDELRSIAGILQHVGGAEWWYLDRLDLAFPRHKVPEEPFERLELVREHLLAVLPTLAEARRVVGKSGEFWSPRKLLRRAIWHERDHTAHILKLLS